MEIQSVAGWVSSIMSHERLVSKVFTLYKFNISPIPSMSDGNTGNLTPGNRLHSWNQHSAGTEFCGRST